jgi:peptidoglycan/xylan/chitin deacetylase (PgdA/CDA1 family)
MAQIMGLTPHRIPKLLPKLFPKMIWRIAESINEKNIYLTFDDGPIPGPTEFVLEELNKRQIRATFFCIGDNIKKYPDILKKVVDNGHSIGNHTFNHLKGWSTSNKKYLENINRCDIEISNIGVEPPKLFRPPYGRIRLNQIKMLSHYKIIMWDVLSLDYQQGGSSDALLNGTINATRNGSIVVFHDSMKAEKNLKFILPRYIDHCSEAGYQFKSL